MKKTLYCSLIILVMSLSLPAQNTIVYPELGYSHNLSKGVGGHAIGLNLQFKTKRREAIGIEIGQIYSEGLRLVPKDYANQGYLLGSVLQPRPFGAGGGDASEFPAASLPIATDRYYNFNLVLKQLWTLIENERQGFLVGIGPVLSYRNEREVAKVVEINGSKIRNLSLFAPGERYLQPIYKMDKYLDLGIMGEAAYRYALSERLFLQGSAKLFYYPPSGNWIATATTAFGFSL